VTAAIDVRPARESDMSCFAAIVNYFIETTTVNFRTHPQSADEWRGEWKLLGERYPWLVAADGGEIVGLAYAGPWKAREAYGWSAESTVYVANGQHRRGIGRLLYDRLLATLDAQGYRSTLGVIALPNAASVALHEACGFRHAGTLASVGFKHGRWCDVGFWQRLAPGGTDHSAGAILPVSEAWSRVAAQEARSLSASSDGVPGSAV
jgi:phosphinothricin acetyltransferase